MRAATIRIAALAAVLATIALPASTLASDELDAVRAATQGFEDVAAAEAAGYAILAGTPLEECIDEPGEGAMGFHYVNGELVGDATVEPTDPEALLYSPTTEGGLRLVGVEYVVFAEAWDAENSDPPALFGHEFHLVGTPNRYELPAFYELHAWVWKNNPSGTFNDWNPTVSCTPLPDTSTTAEPEAAEAPWALLAALIAGLGALAVSARLFDARRRPAR
jgi:hypothetical protein